MTDFIIDDAIFELFPDLQIGIVVAKDITNRWSDVAAFRNDIANDLEVNIAKVSSFLTEDIFSENAVIRVWRDAFQKFKTKKGVRSSIEALLKRIQKDNPPGSIEPLVDIYNSVSLKFALPCGGEDIDSFVGNLRLAVADGGEDFLALGDEDPDPALPGEVIYKDDIGAVCRCWNWRDGKRTMLTEDTTNAFLILESVDPSRSEDLAQAVSMLSNNIKKYLGGNTKEAILNADSRHVSLD